MQLDLYISEELGAISSHKLALNLDILFVVSLQGRAEINTMVHLFTFFIVSPYKCIKLILFSFTLQSLVKKGEE